VPESGEPDGAGSGNADSSDLETLREKFPRWTWSLAVDDARKKREREGRPLTRAELEGLRRFYPESEYTLPEQQRLFALTGEVYEFDPLPPWWKIEAELESVPDLRQAQPVDVTADVELLVGRVLDAVARKHASATRGRPGVKPSQVSGATRKKVAELRIKGETVAAIMRQTRLSKTIATRLVADVDAVLTVLRSGRY
jgi:hypothetical protein